MTETDIHRGYVQAAAPGDRLYYHWLPGMVLPESFTDEERKRADGLPLPGDLIAEIPADGGQASGTAES